MTPLSLDTVKACRHPRLPGRYILAIVCTVLFLPVIALIAVFGTISLILFWVLLFLWVSREAVFAYCIGNILMVSEYNYPRIANLSNEIKEVMGVNKDIHIFVYENSSFNAFASILFFRRAIFLNSEILEHGVSDDEVRMLVGRFIGYWRVQQDLGVVGWFVRMMSRTGVLTLLILPFERAMVYTGDRLGLAAINGDISAACSLMQKLMVGRSLGYSINPLGVIEQASKIKGSIFAFLARLPMAFPHTVTRYVDLIAFAKRQFPDQYVHFEVSNPGLPGNIADLSGEKTQPESIFRLVGIAVALFIAYIVMVAYWMFLLSHMMRPHYHSDIDYGSSFASSSASDTTSSTSIYDSLGLSYSSAAPAEAATELNDPDIVIGVSDEQIAAAYPQSARDNGITGSVTIQCQITADGYMSGCFASSENPSGYGFGDAAVALAETMKISPQSKSGADVGGHYVLWAFNFR